MKKLVLLFAFITAGLFANAQSSPVAKNDNPAGRAERLTTGIEKAVTLTADQKVKVQAINLERTTAMDKNRATNASNKEAFSLEKRSIMTKWNAELQKVLTAEQVTKLKAAQAEDKKLNKGEE